LPSILLIRQAGHEVLSVSELFSGISDAEVIKKAKSEKAIILTFDKDYGEIIFRHEQQDPPAVVFFRFKGSYPETAGHLLMELMKTTELSLEGKLP
jgi:predicted nuclease of predicted toxin-antitoxin system